MTKYDPEIIQKFADRLYRQARSIVAVYGVLGGLTGGIMALGLYATNEQLVLPLLAMLLFVGIGVLIGQSRAFALRLQAQTALCQVCIERNTAAVAGRVVGQPVASAR